MGCLASLVGYSIGNGFVDRCLGLETSCADSCCNGLINILGRFENGLGWRLSNFRRDDGLLGSCDNQLGRWVVDRGWGIIEVHLWNLLGEFDLLFHPWKVYLFARLDDMFVLRLKRLFEVSKSFEVGIIFGVLNPLDGVPQFHNCIDNGVRLRDCGLRDILVLEKDRVSQ